MSSKFRKAEQNSAKTPTLAVIVAITLLLLAVAGGSAIMNKNSTETTPEPEISDKYSGNGQAENVKDGQTVKREDENSAVNTEIQDEPKVLVFSYPCEKDVVCAYSGSTPVFSEILEDWRTHPAIDYAAAEEFDVKAAADGTVEDVYTDGLMGVTVLISHSEELKTLYQSLAETVSVKKGDAVAAGQIIGSAGKTATAEKHGDDYMLHFAILENGKYKDPAEIISQ